MSMKRPRPPDATAVGQAPSKKRAKVDLDLARTWEQIVDEDEEIRLKGVLQLLKVHLNTSNVADADANNAEALAKRLFRGLCSSRKNARQGFYVALAGALSMIDGPFGTHGISFADTITILESQTIAESGTSGQEERDHHYGRLLGCRALLESKLLWNSGNKLSQLYENILGILCKLMEQKPWIRAEGSAVICSTVLRIASTKEMEDAERKTLASHIIQQLKNHRLLHTIDGICVWLTIRQNVADLKMSKKTWNRGSPLHRDELPALKKVLLGQRDFSEGEEGELAGNSVWSPALHPAWSIVLDQLSKARPDQASFEDFWIEIVDKGLFAPSSSTERKYIGLLLLEVALRKTEVRLISACFSKNLMACMIQSLQHPTQTYLAKTIHKTFEKYSEYAKTESPNFVHEVIHSLLKGTDFADFDVLTNTKIITSLLEIESVYQGTLGRRLIKDLEDSHDSDRPLAKVAVKRKNILHVLSRAVCQGFRELAQEFEQAVPTDAKTAAWAEMQNIMESLLDLKARARTNSVGTVAWDESTYAMLKEKIPLMLEAGLSIDIDGPVWFFQIVTGLEKRTKLEAETAIQESLDTSWNAFKLLNARANELSGLPKPSQQVYDGLWGLKAMQAFLLYEVYDGSTEAVEMLEETSRMIYEFAIGQNLDFNNAADGVLEMLISFLSKPSKFRRKICNLIFIPYARYVSSNGLDGINRILATNESRDGQEALFEDGNEVVEDDGSEGESNDESEAPDSDVEVVDADEDNEEDMSSSAESTDLDSAAQEDSDTDLSGAGEPDDELAKFEGALAAALGTRKLEQSDMADMDEDAASDSSSDSDMSDSQMMELDEKLAQVFRNQRNQLSAQKLRKEEMKSAKENVVNLKNRVMDLIEVFLRQQSGQGYECTKILVFLLIMAGNTGTQQLATRGIGIVKNYVGRAKGPRMPVVEADVTTKMLLRDNLERLFTVAARQEASNSLIEVAGQLAVLICKLSVQAGEEDVDKIVGDLSKKCSFGRDAKRKAHESFWIRYEAWSKSMEERQKVQKSSEEKPSQNGQAMQPHIVVSGRSKSKKQR